MSKRRKRHADMEEGELPMTPMIDVVFQLLIYFLVTIHPVDVMAHLDVFRPSPDPNSKKDEKPPKMIRIVVLPDMFTINDRPVGLKELDKLLSKLASIDRNQTILINCTPLSPHEKLIQVLDLCAKSKLVNLSVVSS